MAKREIRMRVQALRRQRETMKLANRFLRAGNDAGLLSLGFTAEHIARLKVPDVTGAIGFSHATLRNIGAKIHQLQGRTV